MKMAFPRYILLLLVNLMTIACAQSNPAVRPMDGKSQAAVQPSFQATVQTTTYEIKIDNFSFTPAVLAVPVGATVKWTNHDDIPHTIVSSDQKFKSKPLDTNDSFSFTFDQPGTYEHFCGLHPKMVGKVIVEAKK